MQPLMSVELCGISFKNPVIAASGTFGFGREYAEYVDLNKVGGIAVKGLTLLPQKGNPPPRIAETPSGILNSVGLQNPGVDYFIEHELPALLKYDMRIIVNINGNTVEEYCRMAEKIKDLPVHFLELNVSCPNVKQGGVAFGTNPDVVYDVTRSVKMHARQPVLVKLTPNVTDIKEIAIAVEKAGGDGISLINTVLGMAIDVKKRRPVLANVVGGLSGPAIKPIALRMVWEVAQVVNIPIVGMGGITTGQDVVEFLLAGATAVGVGTANLMSPTACIDIVKQLEEYMTQHNIKDVKELIGGLVV
jgi:dihydroorotate dehydrogenase (NAD+) catalytic subunit